MILKSWRLGYWQPGSKLSANQEACSWWRYQIETFICAWTDGWVNNENAGDLRCHRAYYDVIVLWKYLVKKHSSEHNFHNNRCSMGFKLRSYVWWGVKYRSLGDLYRMKFAALIHRVTPDINYHRNAIDDVNATQENEKIEWKQYLWPIKHAHCSCLWKIYV